MEQDEKGLRSQKDGLKSVRSDKIEFFKSLFQKFLEIICIKFQLVKYSQWTKDTGSILISMIRPLEVSQFEVKIQNEVRKTGLREFFFFKSLFKKFLEIICIKVQLVKYSQWTKDYGSI